MAINNIFKTYEETILRRLNVTYSGLHWCELGNQRFGSVAAKTVYQRKGVIHTSIDINGLDGAIPLDLDTPIPANMRQKFRVVTNYGTSEHVNNQYSAFKNVHDLCGHGGIMIHGLPLVNNWHNHCRYRYLRSFFDRLASVCSYTCVDIHIFNTDNYKKPFNLISCVLVKEKDAEFISEVVFKTIPGIHDSKDLRYTGNYTKKKV